MILLPSVSGLILQQHRQHQRPVAERRTRRAEKEGGQEKERNGTKRKGKERRREAIEKKEGQRIVETEPPFGPYNDPS